jgi:hypothetical protein
MTQEEMWTNDGPPIYLDATKIRTVEEGSPDAAFLLVAAGGQIPMSVAKQYGVTEKPPEAEQLALPETDAPEATAAPSETDADDATAQRLQAEADRIEAERRKGKQSPNTKLRETPDNKSGQG